MVYGSGYGPGRGDGTRSSLMAQKKAEALNTGSLECVLNMKSLVLNMLPKGHSVFTMKQELNRVVEEQLQGTPKPKVTVHGGAGDIAQLAFFGYQTAEDAQIGLAAARYNIRIFNQEVKMMIAMRPEVKTHFLNDGEIQRHFSILLENVDEDLTMREVEDVVSPFGLVLRASEYPKGRERNVLVQFMLADSAQRAVQHGKLLPNGSRLVITVSHFIPSQAAAPPAPPPAMDSNAFPTLGGPSTSAIPGGWSQQEQQQQARYAQAPQPLRQAQAQVPGAAAQHTMHAQQAAQGQQAMHAAQHAQQAQHATRPAPAPGLAPPVAANAATRTQRPQAKGQMMSAQEVQDLRKDSILHWREWRTRLECPITHDVYIEPVITPYGGVYEGEELRKWTSKNGTGPTSREPMTAEELNTVRPLVVAMGVIHAMQDHIDSLEEVLTNKKTYGSENEVKLRRKLDYVKQQLQHSLQCIDDPN